MKWFLLTLILLLPAKALADVDDIINSTIKLTLTKKNKPETFHGTGFVFDEDDENLYIMSAGHVSKDYLNMTGQFYHDGKESQHYPVDEELNIWNEPPEGEFDMNDMAILSCKKKNIQDYSMPSPVKIASPDYKIKKDEVIYTMGCPKGNYPSLIKGRTITDDFGNCFKFLPNPIAGRSGSGIFNRDHEAFGVILISSEYEGGIAAPPSLMHNTIAKWKELKNGKPTNSPNGSGKKAFR